jgi:hypothetical protein
MRNKQDEARDGIQSKTRELADKVESSLPSLSGESVCKKLRGKPRSQWTPDDLDAWDQYGCR